MDSETQTVFDIIWPQQEWDGDESFCRAVSEKVARALRATQEPGAGGVAVAWRAYFAGGYEVYTDEGIANVRAEKFGSIVEPLFTHPVPAAAPAPGVGMVDTFQQRVQPWMLACFGPEISGDKLERADRFIEEALELVQSGGYPRDRIAALTDYVYNREVGEPAQEAGGVMVTLAAYCLAHGLDMQDAAETELARIWTKVEKIRAKQAAKPTGSALPVALSPASVSEGLVTEAVATWRVGKWGNGSTPDGMAIIFCDAWETAVALDAIPERTARLIVDAHNEALTAAIGKESGWREPSGHVEIAHDGFSGDIIGHYETREGKRGVVIQQDGTRVVHVYGEKWLSAHPLPTNGGE